MKAVCPREGLLSACQIAGVAVAVRDVKPILSNLKLIAASSGITLLATDLDLGVRLEVRTAKVEEAGEALLPAARLTAILREATDPELTLEADAKATMIRGQFNEFEMAGENSGDFPEIATFTDEKYYEVPAGSLREMIRRTIFAVAKSEGTRYSMNGVLWELNDGKAELVATDGRRLALTSHTATNHGAPDTKGQTHVVPVKTMSLLDRLLQDGEEAVQICLRPNEALFKTDRATIYTRLVEGRFPHYQELFTKKLNVKIPLDAGPFHSAVRQANIMAEDESKRVTFTFAKKKVTLQARGAETGRAKVELPLEYDGKEISINFDAQFLMDMLRVLPPDAPLVVEFLDGNTPAVFHSGTDYTYLVMPLT